MCGPVSDVVQRLLSVVVPAKQVSQQSKYIFKVLAVSKDVPTSRRDGVLRRTDGRVGAPLLEHGGRDLAHLHFARRQRAVPVGAAWLWRFFRGFQSVSLSQHQFVECDTTVSGYKTG